MYSLVYQTFWDLLTVMVLYFSIKGMLSNKQSKDIVEGDKKESKVL